MRKVLHVIVWLAVLFLLWVGWHCVSHQWRDLSESPHDGYQKLTVLTYNTQRMGNFEKADKNTVIRYLRSVQADVLCLQEVEVYKDKHYLTLDELRQAMGEYPYTYYDFKIYNARRQYGNVVFSKYPLVNKQTIHYASRGNISSCCDIVVNEDTIRLIVNYLESNRITLKEQRDTLLDKIEAAGKIRWRQAWAVKKAMWQSPYPLIVVGDFNALPIGLTYHCLQVGMRDCFLETSRFRLGRTFMHGQLGARIDYILCSRKLQPYWCLVEDVPGSDHYPLIASIEWAPDSDNH